MVTVSMAVWCRGQTDVPTNLDLFSSVADSVAVGALRRLALDSGASLSLIESESEHAVSHFVLNRFTRVLMNNDVDVYTALAIDDKALRRIGQRIREVIEKEPVLHAFVDESMLGGLTLRIGDQLMDGSVATRLRRLKQNLLTTGTATVGDRFRQIIDEGGEV